MNGAIALARERDALLNSFGSGESPHRPRGRMPTCVQEHGHVRRQRSHDRYHCSPARRQQLRGDPLCYTGTTGLPTWPANSALRCRAYSTLRWTLAGSSAHRIETVRIACCAALPRADFHHPASKAGTLLGQGSHHPVTLLGQAPTTPPLRGTPPLAGGRVFVTPTSRSSVSGEGPVRTSWPCPPRYAADGRRGSGGSCRGTLRRGGRPGTARRRPHGA